MPKIKILYFITMLDQGGAQASVLCTIKGLDKNAFEPFLAVGKGGRLDEHARREVRNLTFLSALRRPVKPRYLVHDLVAFIQMGLLLRKIRPDIVHTTAPKAGILGRLAARIFWPKAKVVHTFHGLGFAKEHGERQFNLFVRTERFCAKLTNVIVFVSRRNADEAKKLGIGENNRCEIIRAGIGFDPKLPENFSPERKKRSLHIPPNAKVVLSVANFKPLKNPIHFVLAAYKVLSQMKNVYFIYTGEGELKESAASLAKNLGIEKQVIFPGWRNDVYELLGISDVYASVSLREGVPISLLEAMAMKVPAVCYDVDGVSEVLANNKTGFLVRKQDIAGLAEKIKALLRHTGLREQFKANIARRDFGEFTLPAMLRKQQQLYFGLAGQKGTDLKKKRFFRKRFHSRRKIQNGEKNGLRN